MSYDYNPQNGQLLFCSVDIGDNEGSFRRTIAPTGHIIPHESPRNIYDKIIYYKLSIWCVLNLPEHEPPHHSPL